MKDKQTKPAIFPASIRQLDDEEIEVKQNGLTEPMVSYDAVEQLMKNPQTLLPLNEINLRENLAKLEKNLIEQALSDSDWVIARAAKRLHICRTTLVKKMRKYNLHKKQEESEIDS